MVENVRSGQKAQVIISPKNFVQIMRMLFDQNYGPHYEKFIDRISEETEREMKKHVPVQTGTLRNSIRTNRKRTQGGGTDKRTIIEVGPTVGYAQFVDRGTRASPGRFVPELGRRIQTGRHPGIKARAFTEKTAIAMNSKIPKLYDQVLLRAWKNDWRSRLRPSEA